VKPGVYDRPKCCQKGSTLGDMPAHAGGKGEVNLKGGGRHDRLLLPRVVPTAKDRQSESGNHPVADESWRRAIGGPIELFRNKR
jgi:hypothetical protein